MFGLSECLDGGWIESTQCLYFLVAPELKEQTEVVIGE